MVHERRVHARISCVSKCFLYHNGSRYPGTLEDLSLSGALVSAADALPFVVQVGDRCDLVYCDGGVICPGEYPSMVVRLSSPRIGLHFELPPVH